MKIWHDRMSHVWQHRMTSLLLGRLGLRGWGGGKIKYNTGLQQRKKGGKSLDGRGRPLGVAQQHSGKGWWWSNERWRAPRGELARCRPLQATGWRWLHPP